MTALEATLCCVLGLAIACQPWLLRRLRTLWQRDARLKTQPDVKLDTLRRHWPKAALLLLGSHMLILALAAWFFGWGSHAIVAIGLGVVTFVLAMLDWRSLWLPDAVVLPLGLLGVMVNWIADIPMVTNMLGAAAGYGSLALLRFCYRQVRGVEGLGGGDVHLAAAMGAWLGIELLPFALLVASLTAIAVALPLFGFSKAGMSRLPFGTFMALSLFASYALLVPAGP
jgi:leader peptidase (prepilin peptidase) / N-methyltransferase